MGNPNDTCTRAPRLYSAVPSASALPSASASGRTWASRVTSSAAVEQGGRGSVALPMSPRRLGLAPRGSRPPPRRRARVPRSEAASRGARYGRDRPRGGRRPRAAPAPRPTPACGRAVPPSGGPRRERVLYEGQRRGEADARARADLGPQYPRRAGQRGRRTGGVRDVVDGATQHRRDTVASRRSPVTRVSVIVTIVSRGSLTSCSRAEATIWEIRLATDGPAPGPPCLRSFPLTRSRIAYPTLTTLGVPVDQQVESLVPGLVLRADHAPARRQQLQLRAGRDEALAAVEHVGDVAPHSAATTETPSRGPAMKVEVSRLGGRHLEAAAQLRDHGPHRCRFCFSECTSPSSTSNSRRSDEHCPPPHKLPVCTTPLCIRTIQQEVRTAAAPERLGTIRGILGPGHIRTRHRPPAKTSAPNVGD